MATTRCASSIGVGCRTGQPLAWRSVTDEHPQMARRHKDVFSLLQLQLSIAFLADIHCNHFPRVPSREIQVHQRTDGMHRRHDRRKSRDTVALASNVEIMRTHITDRGNIVGLGMFWRRDVHITNTDTSCMNPAMKEIDVAKEVVDKRRRGMLIDLLRRADLFDRALMHDHDAVRHFQGLFLIMRHENTGHMQVIMQTA